MEKHKVFTNFPYVTVFSA